MEVITCVNDLMFGWNILVPLVPMSPRHSRSSRGEARVFGGLDTKGQRDNCDKRSHVKIGRTLRPDRQQYSEAANAMECDRVLFTEPAWMGYPAAVAIRKSPISASRSSAPPAVLRKRGVRTEQKAAAIAGRMVGWAEGPRAKHAGRVEIKKEER